MHPFFHGRLRTRDWNGLTMSSLQAAILNSGDDFCRSVRSEEGGHSRSPGAERGETFDRRGDLMSGRTINRRRRISIAGLLRLQGILQGVPRVRSAPGRVGARIHTRRGTRGGIRRGMPGCRAAPCRCTPEGGSVLSQRMAAGTGIASTSGDARLGTAGAPSPWAMLPVEGGCRSRHPRPLTSSWRRTPSAAGSRSSGRAGSAPGTAPPPRGARPGRSCSAGR